MTSLEAVLSKDETIFVRIETPRWTAFRTFVFAFAVIFKFIDPFLGFLPGRFVLYLGVLMVLSLFSLYASRPSQKAYLTFAFLYVLSVLLLVLGESGIPYSVFVAASIYKLGYRKCMRRAFWIGYFSLILTMVLSFVLGINSQYNNIAGSFLENRYTLGFSSPNTPGTLIMLLFALSLCGKGKLDWKSLLLFAVTIFAVYLFTKSRTMIFTMALFLIFYLPACFLLKWKKSWVLFAMIPILFTLGSYLLGIFFMDGQINHLLSGRPNLFHYYIYNRSPVLVSVEDDPSLAGYYLDNLFLADIYRLTIVSLLVLFVLSFVAFSMMRKCCLKKTYQGIALAFFMLMIGSMSESFLATNFNAAYAGFFYFIALAQEKGGILSLVRKADETLGEIPALENWQ